MAGDWIKMRPSLLTSPKINGIARFLESDSRVSRALTTGYNGVMSGIVTRNVMRNVTVASLLVIWGAANEHTSDGVFRDADLNDIDDMVGIPGFGEAMESVGWAVYNENDCSVTLPNFSEYNTSGKERSATAKSGAERQKEYRERKKRDESDVTSDVTSNRREEREKRRENNLSVTHITSARVSKQAESKNQDAFAMSHSWTPSIEFESSLSPDLITDPATTLKDLHEFILYRISTGEQFTQAEWEHRYLKNLQANKKHRGRA